MRILLIGYGNPGRLDDGLGPALAERFQGLEESELNTPRCSGTPPGEGTLSDDGQTRASVPCDEAGGTPAVRIALRGRYSPCPPALVVESNYQLNVEDAAQIAEFDVVVFADASTDAEPPFTFEPVVPEPGGLSFSSHSVSAPQLMWMVKELFHAEPQAFMLAIRGVDFNEFGEKLSVPARENLEQAVEFLKQWIKELSNIE